jgi:hypothetical protein
MNHNPESATMVDQPDNADETVVERFHPTNGRFSGFLGLGCAAVVLVLAVAAWDTGRALGVAIVACLGGVLVWVAMLRPALWATEHDLVLRSMFHTDRVPLGSIDKVAVGQVLAVTAGGKRYVSPVIGYTARQSIKAKAGSARDTKPQTPVDSYQVFVEERIAHLAKEHRDRFGDVGARVRRSYAWPEIAGVAVTAVAFVIWLAL